MDLIMGIVTIAIGFVMIVLGTKLPILFKGLYESVKDEKMIIKLGFTFKIAGYGALILGIIITIRNL